MSTDYSSSLPALPTSPLSPGAHQVNGHVQSMDGRASEYPQSGLNSAYPPFPEPQSEGSSSADQASAAQYSQQGQDPRAANFSASATPTSDYGINPSSARSGSFPEYIQRPYHQPGGQSASTAAMAQATSPSMSLPDGHPNSHTSSSHHSITSDPEVPIDPSIAAATSPTYPPHAQYSPYGGHHEMPHYPGHPSTPMYGGRPEWGGQYPPHNMSYGHPPVSSGPPTPSMATPQRPPTGGHPLSTVYSFVPIPGAQQHKRPRRRYEEIERMYKCGWNGCEKAYGTLNHLNAHVTMQSHGTKRTPEEFKEIRKEWKAKKKEEEAARKAQEESQRQAEGRNAAEPASDNQVYGGHMRGPPPPQMGGPQLPPIGYAPATSGQPPSQYGTQSPASGIEGIGQYAANSSSYPPSPYGQNNQMYQQSR